MANAKAVWGIDIGQCALKAMRCTLGEDGQAIIADKYDYIEYPRILSQAGEQQSELIAEALEQFLSRNEVRGDSVAMSVSGQAGLSRFFKPPPVDAKTLPDIVKYEVKQQIPFPIEDVIWDWQQLGGSVIDDVTVDAEVGLFAMKREAVFRALQPFTDQGIDVDLVQLAPLASYNVICHDILGDIPEPEDIDVDSPPESLVILSIGTDTTDLIVTNGIKLWLRNIPIGGNHFTKQLARELKLTYAKAELLKRNARKAEDPKTVFQAMRPIFNDLVTEIQRSLTFFQSMEKNAKINRIALFGNAAKLPGLRQFLNRQLDLDIVKVSSFKNLQGPGVIDQSSFEDNILSLPPCYGLCIQGLNQARLKTNLLPNEFVIERMVEAKKPWVLASVGALALAFMLAWFFISGRWWQVHDDFRANSTGETWKEVASKVSSTKARSDGAISTDQELNSKLQQINAINEQLVSAADTKYAWMEMFSAIYQALPKDERIKSDSIDPMEIPFEDRKEIFIDHIETKYESDLYGWYETVKPIYDQQFTDPQAQQAAKEAAAVETKTDKQKTKSARYSMPGEKAPGLVPKRSDDKNAVTGPGFVIELKGHHFHNSNKALQEKMQGLAYVMNTLMKNLVEKEFEFPGEDNEIEAGGKYKLTDIGAFYPTLVARKLDLTPVTFDVQLVKKSSAEPRGQDEGDDNQDSSDHTDSNSTAGVPGTQSLEAKRFDFVVQIAWQPRSREDRFKAREKRLEQEKKNKNQPKTAAPGGNPGSVNNPGSLPNTGNPTQSGNPAKSGPTKNGGNGDKSEPAATPPNAGGNDQSGNSESGQKNGQTNPPGNG